ncbi:GvpL/GvpF family gas vesicle protein [Streptomyces sp. 7N604]|uniref:GvpL/GvpF family gas vesicle protein n=1 Tax=Streptomyces sp. 7N604 TaxID=3457415 RepID=UPI003FD28E29
MSEPNATWVYAVTAAAATDPPPGLDDMTGVAGERVRRIESAGLSAVVGSVPLSDFSEPALREHLEDLRWLDEAARAHHRVIDAAVAAFEGVVPLRFATVCHDDERVRSLLQERRQDFTVALERVTGRTEWGVKAYVDPRTFAAGASGPDAAPAAGAGASHDRAGGGESPGAAYLRRRKAERKSQETAHQRAAQRAQDIHTALGALAAESAEHQPQDARLAGYEGWMVLNGSYLVPDDRAEDFASLVASLRVRFPDVRLELSGPWPAYSFTGTESETGMGARDGTGESEV